MGLLDPQWTLEFGWSASDAAQSSLCTMRENWSKNWSQITKLHLWWRRLGEVCLEGRRSKFRSLLIKFTSSLVGLLGPVTSGIGQPASDASRISLLNMRKNWTETIEVADGAPPHPLCVKKCLEAIHSKFSLVACCHLCGPDYQGLTVGPCIHFLHI